MAKRRADHKALGVPCGLLELKADQCCYPIGDPNSPAFHFCAAPSEKPPYCPAHKELCASKRKPGK